MLMFSGPVPGSPALLGAAAVSLGIAASALMYLLSRAIPKSVEPVAGMISEAQLRLRRDRSTTDSALFRYVLAALPAVSRLTSKLPLKSVQDSLAERYSRAGWPGGLSYEELLALSLLIGVAIVPVIALPALLISPLLVPVALIGLLIGPGLVSSKLDGQAKERDKLIIKVMPFVLDLLALTMRAGASLMIAMERVAVDYAGHPVGEEFKATLKDIEMGTTTRQAFKNLGLRVPSEVIRGFVDDVVQAEELGRPMAETLDRLSERVRIKRVQDAMAKAGSAKVMVLIPGMLVFIAVLILLFSPFVVKFYYGGFSLE
ncbi:MAG: type II secretion system F family protein [Planctomycetota bacterium]|nr:type II secretion system F family protein [Planctomycetota bacterium]